MDFRAKVANSHNINIILITKINFLEWNNNPVIITVETTDFPVENISFPTVTVCREDNEPNCFEFVTKIFDYFPFPCFENK
jgi:hypothetical protein